MLTGQNGILNRAQEAKEKTDKAQEDENKKLQEYEDVINKYRDLPTGEETTPYLPNSTFSYKEGDLSTGLVIKDANNNEYVWVEVPTTLYSNATYNNKGANKPNGTDDYTNIELCLKAYTNDYADSSYSDKNSSFTNQYQKMLKSVYTNGGFWIGRYEAGIEGDTPRTEYVKITDNDKAVIKPNTIPYTYTTRDEAQILAERLNYENCTSSLIFGVQWDLALKYIETKGATTKENLTTDSKNIGNYNNNFMIPVALSGDRSYNADVIRKYVISGNSTIPGASTVHFDEISKDKIFRSNNNLWNISNTKAKYSIDYGGTFTACPYEKKSNGDVLVTTGSDTSFSLMNIYDLAGNQWEWTLELYTSESPCVYRGGNYCYNGSDSSAKSRGADVTNAFYGSVSFRVALWK